MGGVVSTGVDNDDLVDKLKEADYIRTHNVEKIFRLVDRGYYMTKDSQSVAYRDNAWRNGNLHISAPCIYAQVMEGLQLETGMSFLNIGSGTGYLSTMAGLIIGPTGINHGIELHGDVVEYARERLAWFLNNAGSIDVCSFCEPQFSQGNALCIKEEDRILYDRVYCGASCPSSHENYMKNLIKVNGVLVMPKNDTLLKIVRTGDNSWNTDSLLPVSFSSLVIPDNSITTEVELPFVNLISLQELSREAIRKHFRSCIEEENESLKNAFIYIVPPKPLPKSRRTPMSCLKRNPANAPMSDTDNDTDDSEGRDGDWENFSSSQSLHESMHSAFIELARSFISRSSREPFDGSNDVEEPEREEIEVEEEEEEEEEVANQEERTEGEENRLFNERESNEFFIGNDHDLIVRIIERVNRRPRTQNTLNNNPPSSKETSLNQIQKEEEENIEEPSTSSGKPQAKGSENDEKSNHKNIEIKEKKEPLNLENTDEEMIDDDKKEKSPENETKESENVSTLLKIDIKPSEEIMEEESSQTPENPLKDFADKEFKKREKFDSGIVEDLDQAMSIDSSSSSCSLKSRSNSESSLSEGSNKKTGRNEGDSDSLDGGLGSIHGRSSAFWRGRSSVYNRRKKRTIKYENESKTDSTAPIEKYSQLMKEKIRQLPLPLPLKVYVNYNRPL